MDPNGANSAHTEEGTSCRASWTVLVGDLAQSPTRFDFILDQQWFLHDCPSSAWFPIPCWNNSAFEVAEPKMASLLGHPCLFVCLFFPFLSVWNNRLWIKFSRNLLAQINCNDISTYPSEKVPSVLPLGYGSLLAIRTASFFCFWGLNRTIIFLQPYPSKSGAFTFRNAVEIS